MNTLHDLRDTLEQHAEGLPDSERHVRPVAVRERIRVARRRRTALVTTAAAVAVAAVASAIVVLDRDSSVDPASRLFDVDVPREVAVHGFPYELAEAEAVAAGDGVRFGVDHNGGDDDTDRAVSLVATGLGSGSATLYVDGEPVSRAFGDDAVELPVPVGAAAGSARVVLDDAPAGARVGIAVYEETGELAPGVDNGEAVFRDEYAGQPLLGAAFAEPGDESTTFEARGAVGAMRFVWYCNGPRDLYVNIDIDGRPGFASQCGAESRDAARGSSASPDGSTVVREHEVRVYLTRGGDGPEVAAEDVEFGAGVYAEPKADARPLGVGVPTQVEFNGRTWVLDHLSSTRPVTADSIGTTFGPEDTDLLLAYVARGEMVRVEWTGRLTRSRGATTFDAASGPASGPAGVLLRGDHYEAQLTGRSEVTGRLFVYRPL